MASLVCDELPEHMEPVACSRTPSAPLGIDLQSVLEAENWHHLITPTDARAASALVLSAAPDAAPGCMGLTMDAQGSPVGAEAHAVQWNTASLVVTKHGVHKVEKGANEQKQYVVSNARKFDLEVSLVDPLNHLLRGASGLRLHVTLLFESGCEVPTGDDELLVGSVEAQIINGTATFKNLQMGANSLSTRHARQRFRLRVAPTDAAMRAAYPHLQVTTEPFKSITKLERKPPDPERVRQALLDRGESLPGGGGGGGETPRIFEGVLPPMEGSLPLGEELCALSSCRSEGRYSDGALSEGGGGGGPYSEGSLAEASFGSEKAFGSLSSLASLPHHPAAPPPAGRGGGPLSCASSATTLAPLDGADTPPHPPHAADAQQQTPPHARGGGAPHGGGGGRVSHTVAALMRELAEEKQQRLCVESTVRQQGEQIEDLKRSNEEIAQELHALRRRMDAGGSSSDMVRSSGSGSALACGS